MIVYKYAYEEKDKITEMFNSKHISTLRNLYFNNCFGLAEYCCKILSEWCILCSVLTFKNGNALFDGGIKIWDDINHKYNIYTHHSVIFLGDCIMDILHSDRLISTQDYVRSLEEDNPKLRLDYTMTGCWYNSEGYPVKITLDDLESGGYN